MISYDMIAAADAAAETCETNGKPFFFKKSVPEKRFCSNIFLMRTQVFDSKTRSDCSWTIILSILRKNYIG